jgi:hypothetical protein
MLVTALHSKLAVSSSLLSSSMILSSRKWADGEHEKCLPLGGRSNEGRSNEKLRTEA